MGVKGSQDSIKGTELVFSLEVNTGANAVADFKTAANVLKGKSIVFHVNEFALNAEKFEEPTMARSRFLYVPIQTSTPYESVYRWNVAELKVTEDLFQPFHDRKDEKYTL